MNKKSIKDKIIQYKEKYKARILSVAVASAGLLSFQSSECKHYEFKNLQCEATINNVKLYNSVVSVDDFYKNLFFDEVIKQWKYKSGVEGYLYINKTIDHKFLNRVRDNKNKETIPVFSVDTFTFTYSKNLQKEDIIYNLDRNTENIPALGLQTGNRVVVRHFVADEKLPDEKKLRLKKQLDTKYNDEYNQTKEHEFQHFLNNISGVNSCGLSIQQLYLLRMHDEISANIKQALAQRNQFLEKNNLQYIGKRFSLYKEEIQKGSISPSKEKFDEKEKKLIAGLVQKQWLDEKRNLYEDRILSATEYVYKNNLIKYTSVENEKLYKEIVSRIYTFELPNKSIVNLGGYVDEIIIPEKSQKSLEAIKNAQSFSEMDKLGEIQDKYGQEALRQYINQKKKEVLEKEKAEKEPIKTPLSSEDLERLRPSKEGVIRYGRRKER